MKTKCEYCKGFTKDDNKGNCSSCGAPRNEEDDFRIPTESAYGTIVNPSFPKSNLRVSYYSSTSYADYTTLYST